MVEPTTSRYAGALLDQTDQLAGLVHGADLDRWVPSCPEWDLRQLVGHVDRAHRFGAELVRRRVREPGEVSVPTTIPVPDDAAILGEWLSAGARELVDVVRTVGAQQPVWNHVGVDLRAGFWLRRMTHETAVYRADVALTVDEQFRLDADLAVDAISSG